MRALRRAALLPALLLPVAHLLGTPSAPAGAAPAPGDPPTAPSASAPDRDLSANSSDTSQPCTAEDLPRTPPPDDALTNAARQLATCLRGTLPGTTSTGGATLRAEGLTVTGLLCGPYPQGVCHARRVVLDEARIAYPGTQSTPGSCTAARRITLSGQVRLRAASLSGRVFGLLPLTLSTAAVPPVPIPYLRLTDVHATGLWSRAEWATTARTTIIPHPGNCPDD
ncbi:hypothetical protein [Streptomyces fumanus]|uniref:Secreted protein n=1 Tax=Streptomyces fumanus TaxID=67302 RepID=A0A919EBY5_9ACTN|nr:hypothetical protein [Streptomyces fumanus]GHF33358.1 hypothetical protein GCM10018772_68730 [Streptomyces fumanus]